MPKRIPEQPYKHRTCQEPEEVTWTVEESRAHDHHAEIDQAADETLARIEKELGGMLIAAA